MVSLFNTSGLTQGTHTVSLVNTGSADQAGQYVGIDLIVWQSEVGNIDDKLITEAVEDTDPRFQYNEESAWSANPTNASFFSNGTGHYTQTYQASATFTFTVRHICPSTYLQLIVSSSPLNTGEIVGVVVAFIIAALTIFATFFYRRKLKAAEAAYEHLCSVYRIQREFDGPATIVSQSSRHAHLSSSDVFGMSFGPASSASEPGPQGPPTRRHRKA
ncbi:hypothetical protein ID866_3672 [Astraeus odoratus]|nr:hypothetical protein ID866_3672 [Astraeus odoratus]